MSTSVTWDGTSTDTIPELLILCIRRDLYGELRDEWEYMPGRAGSWQFVEEEGDRTIEVDCHILGDTFDERRDAVRRTAQLFSARAVVPIIFSDEPDRFYTGKVASAPRPNEWLRSGDFTIELRVGPFAEDLSISSESWSASDNVPHSFSIPDEVDAYPVLVLTSTPGVASFILTVNGTDLTYGDAIPPGESVTISSLSYTVSPGDNDDPLLTGEFNPDDVDMSDVDGDFPILVPGVNEVTVNTPDGSSMSALLSWRRRYR